MSIPSASTNIVFDVTTAGGTKKITYRYASSSASSSDVKAIGTALVTNGDVFDPQITAIIDAYIVTTNVTEYDLS